jgi:periplasmic protein CpxP/Spy
MPHRKHGASATGHDAGHVQPLEGIEMKTWIKRTLAGVFGASLLFGGLAACSHHAHGPWGATATDAERAEWRAHMVDRVAGRLDLDAAQKARLATLSDTLAAQRKTVIGSTDPRADVQSLVAGERFDRDKAQSLIDTKTAAMREASPAVIAAAADFYDSLRPEQQAKVREFMQGRGHRHGWRG